MKYGIDEYSRYVEDSQGERFAIEPYPWFEGSSKVRNIYHSAYARWEILCWHIGMISQHGIREWWELRKF